MLILIAAVTSVIVGCWVVLAVFDRPQLMVPIVMTAVVLDTEGTLNDSIALNLGSTSIYPSDIVVALTISVIALQMACGRVRVRGWSAAWGALLTVSVVSIVRGVFEVGIEPAVASSRAMLLTSAVGLYASLQSIPKDVTIKWVTWSWSAAATAFGLEALVFVGRFGLGSFAATSERALNAPAALVVAQAGLLLYWHYRDRGMIRYSVLAVSMALVLVSQQRTVQVAALVGLLVIIMLERPGQRIMRIAALAIVCLGMVSVLVSVNDGFAASLDTSTSEPFESNSTIAWRFSGWQFIVEDQLDDATVDLLFGDPAGTDQERQAKFTVGVRTTTASAHSQWIESFRVVGVAGLILAVCVMFGPLVVAARRRPVELEALLTAGAVALVFTLTYQVPPSQALLMGSLAAVLSTTPLAGGAGRRSNAGPAPIPIGQ